MSLELSFLNGSAPPFLSREAFGNSTKFPLISLPATTYFTGLSICIVSSVQQVPQWGLVFGDEKPIKGGELFNRSGHVDPLIGLVEDFIIDLD